MSSTNFQLIYDGRALENNEINPRDLSIALVAISDLFENADKLVNEGRTKAEVKVHASFETGCFKINFSSYQSKLKIVTDLFNSDLANSIVNATELLALIFGGVVVLIRFLKGGRPDKIIENEDKSFSVYKNGQMIKAEKKALELYKDYKLRKGFEDLLSPLNKDGIEDVAIVNKENKSPICHITKDEIELFACPSSKEEEIDSPETFETYISLINLSFKEGNKWFVNDGNDSFYITVEDNAFLEKINRSAVKFSKGDILKVKIRKLQFYNFDKKILRSEYFIEQVIDHKTPSNTGNLFDSL